jgi:hypothetical protein
MDGPNCQRARRDPGADGLADSGALARAQGFSDLYPQIGEIDPYGDTTFNRLQIPALLEELNRLLDETDRPSEQQWLIDPRDVAENCRARTHTYLKLYGDRAALRRSRSRGHRGVAGRQPYAGSAPRRRLRSSPGEPGYDRRRGGPHALHQFPGGCTGSIVALCGRVRRRLIGFEDDAGA